MDILPEDAERQLTLESTNTKPNFESLKSRVSQWVLLNHKGRWGHKAIDCKSQGKGKDGAMWYNGNKGKGPGKGGAKGFTKGKGKRMNNFEHSQRHWQTPSSHHDVLLLEQVLESEHHAQEKEQYIHVKEIKETKANSDSHQQWKVPVRWIQAPTKNSKKKLQVRNRFEALRTDDEEFLVIGEDDDPELSKAITSKRGNMHSRARQHRTVPLRLNASGAGSKIDLCP